MGREAKTPFELRWEIALLLLGSGACALIYQMAWQRELRLIFGASTAASSAVLALFVAGLGVGGLVLGRRADRAPRPLLVYARLEAMVTIAAALSPLLLWLGRAIYLRTGGSVELGLGLATVVRLAIALVVLGPATFLMGGTLPAVVRGIERAADRGRRGTAWLYAINTLGALLGAVLATFLLLEHLGNRGALGFACLVNAGIAARAWQLGRREPAATGGEDGTVAATTRYGRARFGFVLVAAAVVGAVFFLMELVWYRMLGPLLGGSVFGFGVVIASALFGIGVGGLGYAALGRDRPATLHALGVTCGVEALLLAVPFALGDRIPVLALFLRDFRDVTGFVGNVASWLVITAIVVVPPSIVAGAQFPLLIALMGQGEHRVGRHVGAVYAANTAGGIVGALAGGFGLLPLAGALGAWQGACGALIAVGLVATFWRREHDAVAPLGVSICGVAVLGGVTLALLGATGPTAVWRHGAVATRRAELDTRTANRLRDTSNAQRRAIVWQAEGVESSVGLSGSDGLSFIVNGKSDGNAIGDASTQVMSGLLGALLHPPRRALVIGLGTGSTAGWLAALPGIERVDVVELEPAILEVARRSAAVNHHALDNPKLHVTIGDAREVLMTSDARYDLVFSEPSNPYRAGVASLFTVEYYEAIAERLAPGGVFLQWLQAYEVDGPTIGTVYATLAEVFPAIETWQTNPADLVLVASATPMTHDVAALRARLETEPFKTAVAMTWRVNDLEGVLAHHVAAPGFVEAIDQVREGRVNTDDRNLIEFSFARSMHAALGVSIPALRQVAGTAGLDRPALTAPADVHWDQVVDHQLAIPTVDGEEPTAATGSPSDQHLVRALALYNAGQLVPAVMAWQDAKKQGKSPTQQALIAEGIAELGNDKALGVIEIIRGYLPAEADAILARLRFRQKRLPEAADALVASFEGLRQTPWVAPAIVRRSFQLAEALAQLDPALVPRLDAALAQPFAASLLDEARLTTALRLALVDRATCARGFRPFEPHPIWQRWMLELRAQCYAAANDPLAERARADLADFIAAEPAGMSITLGR
jgi:spermidine synthase